MDWLIQAAGAALVLLWAADVFLTVLYARSGTGIVSPKLHRWSWMLFRALAPRRPAARDSILSFTGPALMVLTFLAWLLLLLVGFGLLVLPELGGDIVVADEDAPLNFATALYFAGLSLSTLGTGDIVARSGGWQVMMMMMAFIGFSFLSLSVTYLMSVYSALVRRQRRCGRADRPARPERGICRGPLSACDARDQRARPSRIAP
jgi:hypothetical protein